MNLERFKVEFKPWCGILLAPWEAENVLEILSHGTGKTKVRVGHGRGWAILDFDNGLLIDPSYCVDVHVSAPVEKLNKYKSNKKIILFKNDRWMYAEIRSRSYYKLLPTAPNAPPSLEINGIHMHRISGTDPWLDTLAKVKAARIRRGHRVLDTCMGLGYTAIASKLFGASEVFTVELDINVIELAEINPWSMELRSERIHIYNNDITNIIEFFDNNYFDRIIHDPPRITNTTGNLYSESFYQQLYRVLRKEGILFHYTGEPGRRHGASFPSKIAGKLRKVGFRNIYYNRKALGLTAIK